MKAIKYFKYITLSLLLLAGFTSCDDDDAVEAPRLFRPVTKLAAENNNIVVTWNNILGATSYEIQLYKATGEESEEGIPLYNLYKEVTAETSPYTFEQVEWDEKYAVRIKSVGENVESDYYKTEQLSVNYPTMLSNIRTIDTAALITWKKGGTTITSLNLIPVDDPENNITVDVSQSNYDLGEIVVNDLRSNTSYTIYAYSGEEQSLDTYEGRASFKTREGENLNETYGEGMYIDLRAETDENVLLSTEFLEQINATEGMTVILRGGFSYKLGSSIKFQKSVNFITGLTLEGNATIVQGAALQAEKNAQINKISFTEINFISDKAVATPIEKNTEKAFGGRQVYNVNGSSSTIKELIFKDCRIEGYRAMVRLQADTDGVESLIINRCKINGVGDQGVITTNNKKATLNNVEISESTITNIVMLADLRSSAKKPTFTITDCTFCYAPIETTANANTPMFRLDKNDVDLSIKNTIFGPSMATKDSKGSALETYTAGAKGSIFVNASVASPSVTNSFKTNFTWTDINAVTYPLEGLTNIAADESEVFTEPEKEDFKIKYTFAGSKTAGASEWRMD